MSAMTFYVRLFTRAGTGPEEAIRLAKAVVSRVVAEAPVVTVEAYDKLGLYSDRITVSLSAPEGACLALFDGFLAEASGGWAILPFDEEVTLREAVWDSRETDDMFLHPSVRGAFLGVFESSV